MNAQYSVLGRAMVVFVLCISAAACPGSDKATGPQDPGGDSIPNPQTPDRTAPTVRATRPANNGIDVDVASAIEVDFSEAIDAASLTTASFKIDGIAGTVSLTGTTARFAPNAPFQPGVRHVARVTTQVRDTAGNSLAQEYSWAFTTRTAPPVFAPLPLSAGKTWRYMVGDTASICTRTGCSRNNFAGISFVHVEKEVSWEGRSAWRTMVYRLPVPFGGPSAQLTVRTEYVSQRPDGLSRWARGAWRTVLPSTGSSFSSGAFLLIDGPTHTGTTTLSASSVTVPAGSYATLRAQHEFRQTGQYEPEDIFETRTEHYAQDVGLVLGTWDYSKDDNDPSGIDESRRGRIALAPGEVPTFTEEQEPNDAHRSPNALPYGLSIFSGSVHINDAGATLRDAEVGCAQVCIHPNYNGQTLLQDWHRVTIPEGTTVSIQMVYEAAFPGASRSNDLDLYAFRLTPAGLRFVTSSVKEPGEFEFLNALTGGTYYLAVQAWDTPASAVRYWILSNIRPN